MDAATSFAFAKLEDKVAPMGELDAYLCVQLQEHRFSFDWVPEPYITQEMQYVHTGLNRPIRVYNSVDSRLVL